MCPLRALTGGVIAYVELGDGLDGFAPAGTLVGASRGGERGNETLKRQGPYRPLERSRSLVVKDRGLSSL